MPDEISRLVEDAPGFKQERIQWSLDEVARREVNPATGEPSVIKRLMDYWLERRVGEIPDAATFDPKGLFTPDEFRFVAWVDVVADDPGNFVLRNHPAYLFGDWSDKRLREYHIEYHGRNCALEYLMCKTVQQPIYHELRHSLGELGRHYTRIVLPVSDRRHLVRRVYYAVHHLNNPILD